MAFQPGEISRIAAPDQWLVNVAATLEDKFQTSVEVFPIGQMLLHLALKEELALPKTDLSARDMSTELSRAMPNSFFESKNVKSKGATSLDKRSARPLIIIKVEDDGTIAAEREAALSKLDEIAGHRRPRKCDPVKNANPLDPKSPRMGFMFQLQFGRMDRWDMKNMVRYTIDDHLPDEIPLQPGRITITSHKD